MKKIISILFISIILLDIFPILDVSAEKNVDTDTNIYISKDGNYKYKKEYFSFGESNDEYLNKKSQGVRLVKYVGKKKLPAEYTVPETIDGYNVYAIANRAFKGYDFTEVIINNDKINIGDAAFYGCEKLKSVTMKNPYYIGSNAFCDCKKLSFLKVKDNNCYTYVDSYAFYNCPKLKSAYISYLTEAEPYSFGYHYDKASKKKIKVRGFAFRIKEHKFGTDNINYAYENNFKCVCYLSSNNPYVVDYAQAGEEYWLKLDGKSRSGWKSTNSDVIKITKTGRLTFLQSGEATIKLKLKNGKTFKRKISVSEAFELPRIENKTISIKRGKTVKIRIYGKANSIKCICINKSEIAKVISEESSNYIKVKGIKKGTTSLKIKVNGVKTLKLKVKIK